MPAPAKKSPKKVSKIDGKTLTAQLRLAQERVKAEASDAQKAIAKTSFATDVKSLMGHPLIFGAGIGIGNGLLAKARGMSFTTRAALVTVGVLTLGEAILAADQTDAQRHGRTPLGFGLIAGVGVLLGLAMFTDWAQWAGGERPILVADLGKKTVPAGRNAVVPSAPNIATA